MQTKADTGGMCNSKIDVYNLCYLLTWLSKLSGLKDLIVKLKMHTMRNIYFTAYVQLPRYEL
jgi:hypothetical protein